MKRLPVWFERTENLAIAVAVVVVFVRLHFSWWWLPVFFLAFDRQGGHGRVGCGLVRIGDGGDGGRGQDDGQVSVAGQCGGDGMGVPEG